VLIVDDNEDARVLLAGLLAAHGYEVESAGEADDALLIATRFRPQVVVLDIGLPGIDGWELARRLRGISGLEQIRLVALTGYGSDRDRERSRDAGIDEHLLKPIEVSQLTRSFA
jgi:CheY-like chemotaxis protein